MSLRMPWATMPRMTLTSLLRVAGLSAACWLVFGMEWGSGASAQSVPQVYSITGTLVSSVTRLPIAHGHLAPTLVVRGKGGRQRFPAAAGDFETDEQGRFSMTLPSAGAWNVTASARGFVRQAYLEHDQFSTAVVLTREAPRMELRFALSPEADVTGVVQDEAGEAVRRAQVSLVEVRAAGPDRAEARAVPRASTMTDDRGMYEFAGLAPGEYRVCVQAQPWYAVATGSMRGFNMDGERNDASGGPASSRSDRSRGHAQNGPLPKA